MALGEFSIESLNHLELSLSDQLAGFEDSFSTGTVRCELLGDADSLQGWAVISDTRGQTFELPFSTPTESESNRLLGFWDMSIPEVGGRVEAALFLLNTTDQHIQAQVKRRTASVGTTSSLVDLAPRDWVELSPAANKEGLSNPSGSIAIEHDGPSGAVQAAVLLNGRSTLRALELIDPVAAPASSRYESLPLPRAQRERRARERHRSPRPWVSVFNEDEAPQVVTLETIDATSGRVLAEERALVESGRVRTLVPGRVATGGSATESPVRIRIRGESDSLRVRAGTVTVEGVVRELAFFAYEESHGRGTYPLPGVEKYETTTTLVNLGDEDAMVGVQVHWDRGTYAYGPLTVPAQGMYRISLEEVAEKAEPDVLGRKLDPRRPDGVLKWTVMKGSTELIGRTEARPRESEDAFGFNCFGCCWENAVATVEPDLVEFTPGQSRSFQSCLTYNDCSGTMGPYPVNPDSMTVPSPFSWDSSTVSASSAADATLEFGVQFLETRATCTTILKWLFGFGRAELCQETFNPQDYNPHTSTCSQQTSSCVECLACCHNIYQMLLCQGKQIDAITADRNTCLGICHSDYNCN